ncbi:hypothetical protein D7W81_33745 [Corallococcus aberystwythensis]|uniref:Uncharacterized protein n=1 Tax=Corallococcus aberystwythensis TaxID=2316722 RepID=A0A3A8PJC7_9BACT|nr:hypothetical protein D7W81_33745 [Corallococcus aberystwythensis]
MFWGSASCLDASAFQLDAAATEGCTGPREITGLRPWHDIRISVWPYAGNGVYRIQMHPERGRRGRSFRALHLNPHLPAISDRVRV